MPVCRLYLIFNVVAKPQSFFVGAVFAGVAVCPDTAGSADPGAHRLYLFFAAVMFAAPVAAVMGYCDNGPAVFVEPLTDIYLQVLQDSGEIRVFDDDDRELTRCVVEEWIGNTDENFYTAVQPILTEAIKRIKDVTENVAVLKPYSYVLVGEDHETLADIYLVDDENIVISGELMEGLNEDLENFWEDLAKEDVL